MIDYSIIGSRIRQYRLEMGMTQEELAFEINTSAAYISDVERAIKKPSLAKLSEIADLMQVTINDFLYDADEIDDTYFDRDLQEMLSRCTPEKQRAITRSIAQIINTITME